MNDSDERVEVAVEDALSRLVVDPAYDDGGGPRSCVHTFRSAPFGLLGAYWGLEEVRAAMAKYGVSESGFEATGMKHGLVLIDETGPVFLETQAQNDFQ